MIDQEDSFTRKQRGKMMDRLKEMAEDDTLSPYRTEAIAWAIEQIEDLRNDNLTLAAELDEALEDMRVMQEGEER